MRTDHILARFGDAGKPGARGTYVVEDLPMHSLKYLDEMIKTRLREGSENEEGMGVVTYVGHVSKDYREAHLVSVVYQILKPKHIRTLNLPKAAVCPLLLTHIWVAVMKAEIKGEMSSPSSPVYTDWPPCHECTRSERR